VLSKVLARYIPKTDRYAVFGIDEGQEEEGDASEVQLGEK
jgi:hypothetical protein